MNRCVAIDRVTIVGAYEYMCFYDCGCIIRVRDYVDNKIDTERMKECEHADSH